MQPIPPDDNEHNEESTPRNTRRALAHARTKARLGEAEGALRDTLGLLWRIHVLSYLMVRRVHADPSLHVGLSLVAWRIVITLANVPDLSANEITTLWGFEKMAVNRGVKELLERGLVARSTDPHGGRRIPLKLTKAGRHLHAGAWPGAAKDYGILASALSPADLETFSLLMDKLIVSARDLTA